MPVSLVKSFWSDGSLIFAKIGTSATTGISFGEDGTGLDIKFFGDTASSFLLWDQSGDELVFDAADVHLGDNDEIRLGDLAAGDVVHKWTGSAYSTTVAASSSWNIGASASNINITQYGTYTVGADTDGFDVKFFGSTTGKYFLWDESADKLIVSGTTDAGTSLEADAYTVGSTAGTDFASGAVTNLHVIKGIVVYAV